MLIAIDTETTGLNTQTDKAFLLSYCTDEGRKDTLNELDLSLYEFQDEPTYIFHNAKFDIKMLQNIGIAAPKKWEDTMLMAHHVNEYNSSNSLENLARTFLKAVKFEDPRFVEWKKKNRKEVKANGYLNAPRELIVPYAINDAVLTLKLFMVFRGALKKMGQWKD